MAVAIRETTDVKRHVITLDEFERMCERGVFDENVNIELIRGEIVDMPQPGTEHSAVVSRLNLYLGEQFGRRAIIWPQGNPIALPASDSMPLPDLTVIRWRDDHYAKQRPQPEDVILLVEVSKTTIKYDRGTKLALYAEAGIPAYWVVNIDGDTVEVYGDPVDGAYQSVRIATRGETILLPGEDKASIIVTDILGQEG